MLIQSRYPLPAACHKESCWLWKSPVLYHQTLQNLCLLNFVYCALPTNLSQAVLTKLCLLCSTTTTFISCVYKMLFVVLYHPIFNELWWQILVFCTLPPHSWWTVRTQLCLLCSATQPFIICVDVFFVFFCSTNPTFISHAETTLFIVLYHLTLDKLCEKKT